MKYLIRLSLLLLVAVSGAYGYLQFAFSEPDRPVQDLIDRWAKAPSQFLSLSGMQVHYRDEGPKEDPLPIILVHGTSASLHTWNGWTEVLSDHHRVIRFDMPGFGLTGPHPQSKYRIEDYAKTLIKLMDAMGIDSAIVAGNSLGGYVAWSAAVLFPERVAKLVLVDSSGYPFESDSVPIAFRIYSSPILKFLFGNIMPRSVVKSSLANVYGNPDKITEDLVDRYFELSTREGNREALAKRFVETKAGQLADRVSELTQETLIIWGDKDHLIPISSGHRFHREIPNSQFKSFSDLGHVPHEEDPLATVQAVEKFLHSE
ncbi:alpha/beta fold hydrolase [Paraglaciecola arctica]|uniref:Alpha/beta hydrolase fold n=1 Tax=Paraglaciecola arctica BSs20135 TaxID=493475 RepID=K6Z311_9ALTE|nr:alpha/beta hydrolase [Paraglaciecola arctica]GAC17800.1 alpha/beta hydrolase fold [Paraglaciecola arctica BSs20135]